MAILSIRLFGEFRATDHRENPLVIGSRKTQALLIWLAIHRNTPVPLYDFGALFGVDDVAGLARDLRFALRFLPADLFAVRWTGIVQPRLTDNFSFYTTSDDGVRLWVDNQLIIDNWTDHGPTASSNGGPGVGSPRHRLVHSPADTSRVRKTVGLTHKPAATNWRR